MRFPCPVVTPLATGPRLTLELRRITAQPGGSRVFFGEPGEPRRETSSRRRPGSNVYDLRRPTAPHRRSPAPPRPRDALHRLDARASARRAAADRAGAP